MSPVGRLTLVSLRTGRVSAPHGGNNLFDWSTWETSDLSDFAHHLKHRHHIGLASMPRIRRSGLYPPFSREAVLQKVDVLVGGD